MNFFHFLKPQKNDQSKTQSLHYRKNQKELWKGNVPDRYREIVPLVAGDSILEIGSAEGVLSLLLAANKKKVIALERTEHRHQAALELQKRWKKLGQSVENCQMVQGDILQRLELLEGVDTVLACRVIYYFRENLDNIFQAIAAKVPRVVLCGNTGREKSYEQGNRDRRLGEFEYYATEKGMIDILTRFGYEIAEKKQLKDPIIVGVKK